MTGWCSTLDSISVQEIREHADYPAFRVRVGASIGPWMGIAAWDVATGDPIVPAPRRVRIDRVLGDPIVLLGYAPETTIEKGVTILERGITSTRWRDYVDIVQLARRASAPTSCSAQRGPWPTSVECTFDESIWVELRGHESNSWHSGLTS